MSSRTTYESSHLHSEVCRNDGMGIIDKQWYSAPFPHHYYCYHKKRRDSKTRGFSLLSQVLVRG